MRQLVKNDITFETFIFYLQYFDLIATEEKCFQGKFDFESVEYDINVNCMSGDDSELIHSQDLQVLFVIKSLLYQCQSEQLAIGMSRQSLVGKAFYNERQQVCFDSVGLCLGLGLCPDKRVNYTLVCQMIKRIVDVNFTIEPSGNISKYSTVYRLISEMQSGTHSVSPGGTIDNTFYLVRLNDDLLRALNFPDFREK